MDGTQWDIREVKRLKKKQLVQSNLIFLTTFILIYFLVETGMQFVVLGLVYIIIFAVTGSSLYSLKTGETIGTKTTKRIEEFEKDRVGIKRWKRSQIIGAVIMGVLGIGLAAFLFKTDLNTMRFDTLFFIPPLLGACIGHNIGEIFRLINL